MTTPTADKLLCKAYRSITPHTVVPGSSPARCVYCSAPLAYDRDAGRWVKP